MYILSLSLSLPGTLPCPQYSRVSVSTGPKSGRCWLHTGPAAVQRGTEKNEGGAGGLGLNTHNDMPSRLM